ncbi:ATP-dependent nuclease [Lysobacter solisilvae (ex Woo and Kim 2020)]|uniref:AAA family ATPase n=1 Tax=Agrilutibacter terrestris TaxID=2865112 RepID=A0A7H0G004_9GAMM|nr:AAA family ATPase [Lysobacter terrestris]QNP41620.1 AAA family ATPase [Lysobacter terrestris]
MYVSEIHIRGFRCFSADSPLTLKLRSGLNILAGPNDAGKTAIIDAPRHVLWTRGDDFVRLDPGDFHVSAGGERATEMLIRCSFEGLEPDEEARFLEWCTNENGVLRLYVCLRASLRKQSGGGFAVATQYRAGRDADGLPLEGELREYLKATYLKPLRDAERELRSGRRSRLSRILGALPVMASQSKASATGETATLVDVMKRTDDDIDDNNGVTKVEEAVNSTFLDKLSFANDQLTATLGLGAKGSFEQLLERMELYLDPPAGHTERVARGLGYNNLLFMAAELLLLESHPEQVPFLLIEEPEAHLHPQHQTLFMQLLEEHTVPPKTGEDRKQVQILLTTHSPQLAAGAHLENVTLVVNQSTFSLDKGQTKLEDDDYTFLRRFLDATKANLFFARGLLIIEGDAENLLLPTVARKLGRPLGKHGVSIVNVGHRGLFRYSRILQRLDDRILPIPIALIPDRDIPPDAAKGMIRTGRRTESDYSAAELADHMATLRADEGGCVKAFPSEQWTLEYDLARTAELAVMVHQAVMLAKRPAGKTSEQIKDDAAKQIATWRGEAGSTDEAIAARIYEPMLKKSVSKAQVAEQMAKLIDELPDDAVTFRRKLPNYLVKAVDYVTSATPHPEDSAAEADEAAEAES